MGRYKKTAKKKTGAKEPSYADSSVTAMEWARDNIEKVLAIAGVLVLAAAGVSGLLYYRHASAEREYTTLYEAVAPAAGEDAGDAALDDGLSSLRKFLEKDVSKGVEAQARFWLGDFLIRKDMPEKAASEYDRMAKITERGTLFHELALARRADALWRAGDPAAAAETLRKLYESAEHYPRSTALYNLALALAAANDKDEAADTINRLIADHPSFQSSDFLEATIRRIRSGALAARGPSDGKIESEKPEAMPVGASDVHGGAG
ncbi:MAG: tetratricopeptide repeat protein [Candidatus Nitrospinota bacterium M3_3B_026]